MVEQASLESKFNEQECSNTEKFVMTEPLKRCKKCGKFKPKSEFYNDKYGKEGLRTSCKDCDNIYKKDYYEGHKDESKKYNECHKEGTRERLFLHNKTKYNSAGYFYGTGICLVCGENHSLKLENHHVIPKDDMVVSLCASCHKMYRAGISQDKHMISVLNAIENSKFLWDTDGHPKGLKPIPMWTADLPLKEAIEILKSYDLPGYEPIGIEV